MTGKKRNKLNKRAKLATIITASALAVILSGALIFFFRPINLKYDESLIAPINNNVKLLQGEQYEGIKTLAKVDKNGNITDEAFKILAFTDMHLDHKEKNAVFTIEAFIANIMAEQPDMVVFVGDIITASRNRGRTKQLAELMEKLNVYWGIALGNHEGDNAQSISRETFGEIYSSYPHCLFEADPKTLTDGTKVFGVGNYAVNIAGSTGIRQTLFFMDGGDRATKKDINDLGLDNDSYDYLKPNQIQWYRETVDKITAINGGVVPSMMYVHIPLAEFSNALQNAPRDQEGNFVYHVAGDDGTIIEYGEANEKVCSPTKSDKSGYSCGMFDAILEKGSTKAVVSGHDHVNNFRIKYKGIYLMYNQNSGYSSYNAVTKKISDKLMQGCTVYTIDKNGGLSFDTIINADRYPQKEILKLYK